MRICIECGDAIKSNEDWEELPGNKAIHEDCIDGILNRPVAKEGEATRNSREPHQQEW